MLPGVMVSKKNSLYIPNSQISAGDGFETNSGVDLLIEGSYFQIGDEIVMHGHIINGMTGYRNETFGVKWNISSVPATGIEIICQQILDYWISLNDLRLAKNELTSHFHCFNFPFEEIC